MTPALAQVRVRVMAEARRQGIARPWWRDAVLFSVCAVITGIGSAALVNTDAFIGSRTRFAVAALAVLVSSLGAIVAIRPGSGAILRKTLVGAALVCALAIALTADRSRLPTSIGNVGCAAMELLIAAIPLIVGILVLSRFAPHAERAVVAGLAAGSAGIVHLTMVCPDTSLAHVGVCHVGSLLLVACLALAVRHRVPTSSHAP